MTRSNANRWRASRRRATATTGSNRGFPAADRCAVDPRTVRLLQPPRSSSPPTSQAGTADHTTSPLTWCAFAAVFGGVAQFMAGMRAYPCPRRAGDGDAWTAAVLDRLRDPERASSPPERWPRRRSGTANPRSGSGSSPSRSSPRPGDGLIGRGSRPVRSAGHAGSRLRHPRRAFIYGSEGWTTVAGWVLVVSAGSPGTPRPG